MVVGVTSAASDLDARFRRHGRFQVEVEVGPLSAVDDRLALLRPMLGGIPVEADHQTTEEAREALAQMIARATHGYTVADLLAAVRTAVERCVGDKVDRAEAGEGSAEDVAALARPLNEVDVHEALLEARPAALAALKTDLPAVSFDDLAGVDAAKEAITAALLNPLRNGAGLARLGIRPPGGILVHGPPGCGKSSLVYAAIAASGLNCVAVRGTEVIDKVLLCAFFFFFFFGLGLLLSGHQSV